MKIGATLERHCVVYKHVAVIEKIIEFSFVRQKKLF